MRRCGDTGRFVGALLAIAWVGTVACTQRAARTPDILLITLDTLRVDRVGLYGYPGETTPNLDRLAEHAMVYTDAISTASWTYPAHVSLFTGKFPASHGASYDPSGSLLLTSVLEGPDRWKQYRVRGLARGESTLARILGEAGYRTGAIVGGPWLKRIMGLDDGFERYDDANIDSMNGRTAPEITDRALAWLSEDTERPFFLFLNYFDAHAPMRAPPEFDRPLPEGIPPPPKPFLSRGYDAEVRFVDHHLGRLLDGLRALGRYEDTWILITSDHGELLGEHGLLGHGNALYEELIRVPLVVKAPGRDGPVGHSDEPAQQVDVFATIVDAVGLEIPRGVQGQPLGRVDHPVIAEVNQLGFMEHVVRRSGSGWRGDQKVLRDGRYKLVWSSMGRHQLFDVRADPMEQHDLVESDAVVAKLMQQRLNDYLAALPAPGPEMQERRTVDPETEAALRSLGYLE